MKIVWERRAISDLREIVDYLDGRNPRAAETTYRLVVGSVDQLAEYPFIGRIGRVAETREMIVNGTPYLVAYALQEETITILAVLHAARHWPDGFPPLNE